MIFRFFCTPLKLRSTHENRHLGASFMSVGGVEAEISMPQNTEKDRNKSAVGMTSLLKKRECKNDPA